MTRLAALMAVLLLAAGCTSNGSGPASPRCDAHCQSQLAEAVAEDSASINPNNQLTGFGASQTRWDANHDVDTDPALDQECCYGPQIKFVGQSSPADTWVTVMADGGVVYSFQHNFEPHTNRTQAMGAIQTQDLPTDARLLRSKVGDGCELFLYESTQLADAAPTLGSYISVYFVSPPDASVYYDDNIWYAGIATSTRELGRC